LKTGAEKQGVQLVSLSDRISNYDGDVSIRLLEVVRSTKMIEDLSELRNKIKDRPYEQSKIELIKSAYDGPLGSNDKDLSSLFCSELVAEAYQCMGLIPSCLSSNEYQPSDFFTRI